VENGKTEATQLQEPVIDYSSISEDQRPDQVEEARKNGEVWEVETKTKKKRAVHNVVVVSIYTLWFFAFSVLAVRLWHLITPEEAHWLYVSEIQRLDNFLFSGVVGSILAKYGDKILGD
jgi:hypothetical protein